MKFVIIFTILTVLNIQLLLAKNVVPKNGESDSSEVQLFTTDYPQLKTFDSLYTNSFYTEDILHPWQYVQANYADSVPDYMNELYAYRLKAMDTKSPFSYQYNDAVVNMIYFYTVKRKGSIARIKEKESLYMPLFEEMLDKYQLPNELKYLAIVESALVPEAVSHAGAVGLWQFMPATGKMYGLNITPYSDDRRDVIKATEAACQHFRDLYKIYGDWNLVLAAYNAGSGNVNKAIKRAGSKADYWEIRKYLPKETQSYVPAFIAVSYMMEYSWSLQIPNVRNQELTYFSIDTLMVENRLTFNQIAEWLEMDAAVIAKLNPQYTKQLILATPEKPCRLTLPNNKIGEFILNRELIISGITRRDFESQASNP